MRLFLTAEERQALKLMTKMLRLEPRSVFLSILLGVLTLVNAIGLSVVAAWLIARASQTDLWFNLAVAAVAVRMFGVGRALFRYFERIASHAVALGGVANLRHSLYTILASSSTAKVASIRRGEIFNRTGADVDAVGDYVVKSLLPAVVTTIVGVLTVGLFAFFSAWAAVALAICLLVAGLGGPMLTARSARIAAEGAQRAQQDLAQVSMTVMDNATELSVNGQMPRIWKQLEEVEDEIIVTQTAAARPAALAAGIDTFAMGAAVLCGFLIGVPLVVSGTLWDVNLAILVLAPLAAFEGTALLAPAAVQLVHSAGAACRIVDLLGGSEEVARRLEAGIDLPAATTPLEVKPPEPLLVAKDLSVGWNGKAVATGINLELTPAKRLAIVGPSGIGKSTLLYTLAGMIPPVSGTLTLGGKPIQDLPRAAVTQSITLTAEDAHVFLTTVLENLRVGNGTLTVEQAQEYLEKAGLGQWIAALPAGIDTVLGSGGTTVSGGERRRILLARALATASPLLLLDEPGEHLDAATADKLVGDLLQAGTEQDQQRGVLLVTHRLSALGSADEVLMFGKPEGETLSRIVARGTHQELIEKLPAYAWALKQEQGNA